MKVINETETLREFKAWSGAKYTQATIIEKGKTEDFDAWIEDMYPDGLTDVALNDILWFEEEQIYEALGIEVKE